MSNIQVVSFCTVPIEVYYKGMISVFNRLRIYSWWWAYTHLTVEPAMDVLVGGPTHTEERCYLQIGLGDNE